MGDKLLAIGVILMTVGVVASNTCMVIAMWRTMRANEQRHRESHARWRWIQDALASAARKTPSQGRRWPSDEPEEDLS